MNTHINYCPDCDYEGTALFHLNRHLKTKLHTNNVEYNKIYKNLYQYEAICEQNVETSKNINGYNELIKKYNKTMNEIFNDEVKCQFNPICFEEKPKKADFITSHIPAHFNKKVILMHCPFCTQSNQIKKMSNEKEINNNVKMSLSECSEHVKTCSNKILYDTILENSVMYLHKALCTIGDMYDGFEKLVERYNRIEKTHKNILKEYEILKETQNIITSDYEKLKAEHDNFISIKARYDELKGIYNDRSKNENNGITSYTINNTSNFNTFNYICNNFKEANPIDCADNRKIIKNKYEIDHGKLIEYNVDDEDITDYDESKFPLEKMLIGKYESRKIYRTFIADLLIDFHKTEEITKRPLWTTDTSRYSFIIKTVENGWIRDKNGDILIETSIVPLIDCVIKLLDDYQMSLAKHKKVKEKEFMTQTKLKFTNKLKRRQVYDFTSLDSCILCNEDYQNFAFLSTFRDNNNKCMKKTLLIEEILRYTQENEFPRKVMKEISPKFCFKKSQFSKLN